MLRQMFPEPVRLCLSAKRLIFQLRHPTPSPTESSLMEPAFDALLADAVLPAIRLTIKARPQRSRTDTTRTGLGRAFERR